MFDLYLSIMLRLNTRDVQKYNIFEESGYNNLNSFLSFKGIIYSDPCTLLFHIHFSNFQESFLQQFADISNAIERSSS